MSSAVVFSRNDFKFSTISFRVFYLRQQLEKMIYRSTDGNKYYYYFHLSILSFFWLELPMCTTPCRYYDYSPAADTQHCAVLTVFLRNGCLYFIWRKRPTASYPSAKKPPPSSRLELHSNYTADWNEAAWNNKKKNIQTSWLPKLHREKFSNILLTTQKLQSNFEW